MRRQQFHHQGEERRLRTAQVVAAVAVGDVPEGVNFIGEVVHHIADFIPVAAFGQAQHGEIAIPVIHLAETSPGHDVGFRQGQE